MGSNEIYPVYIISRVLEGILNHAKKEAPNEVIGYLIGYKRIFKDKLYVKIIDWATGRSFSTHTFAEILEEGVMDAMLFIKERYGWKANRPRIVGIYHSHPFGVETNFSSLDLQTFHNPLFAAELNTFILIDPYIDMIRVFTFLRNEGKLQLSEVDWCEYTPFYGEITNGK